LEKEIQWDQFNKRAAKNQRIRIGEQPPEKDVCQSEFGVRGDKRRTIKKVVKPVKKREVVEYMVQEHSLNIRQACCCASFLLSSQTKRRL